LKRGYSLMAVNSTDSVERQRDLLSLLRSQQVEGILLVLAATPTPMTHISRVMEAGIPLVCVDRIPEKLSVDSVSVEDTPAAELGVDHLLSMGYRRIAIVTGPLSLANEQQRLLGYERSLQRVGVAMDHELIWQGNVRTEDVAALCGARLRGSGKRPDAIFCTNGPTALGALRALRDSGLKTPDDIGFVTFDELTVDELFTPAITTIVQPAYDIGFRASEILLSRIDQQETGKNPIAVRLKVRDSSRRAAGTLMQPAGR
jgi:DNA-binding LacI/PurR family transcriptional regulator